MVDVASFDCCRNPPYYFTELRRIDENGIPHMGERGNRKDFPDFAIMQYTGLKDKNGVEIWEGDIIKIHNYSTSWKNEPEFDWRVLEIKWNVCTWACSNDVLYTPLSDYNIGTGEPYEIEVLGNIYEHPHLLTPH